MAEITTFLALVANLAICVRLITYRAHTGATHRPGASLVAWVLIASTGGQALQILLYGPRAHVSPWQLGLLLVVLLLTFQSKGNVARILRTDP